MMLSFQEWLEQPMPEWIFHVTSDARGIKEHGFLTAEKLGPASDLLGGSIRDAVSFTTLLEF